MLSSTPTMALATAQDRSDTTNTRRHGRARRGGGSSARIGVPILPPISTSRPTAPKRCAISAVVVDLPLVPVIATNGEPGATFARSRQNSSMSPMISTPACLRQLDRPMRLRMGQRHAGRQHERCEIVASLRAQDRRSSGLPRALCRTPCSLSSQAATSAPPATSAARRREAGAAEAEQRDLLALRAT